LACRTCCIFRLLLGPVQLEELLFPRRVEERNDRVVAQPVEKKHLRRHRENGSSLLQGSFGPMEEWELGHFWPHRRRTLSVAGRHVGLCLKETKLVVAVHRTLSLLEHPRRLLSCPSEISALAMSPLALDYRRSMAGEPRVQPLSLADLCRRGRQIGLAEFFGLGCRPPQLTRL